MLFATLDPVLRRVAFSDGLYFLLSDTVGFIRKLPVELITSFRATLEEIRESDCICHVIDLAAARSGEQAEAVEKVLAEIGAVNIPLVRVFNKIDLLPGRDELLTLQERKTVAGRVYVSARTGEGVADLKKLLRGILFQDRRLFHLRLPLERSALLPELAERGVLLKAAENTGHLELTLMARPDAVRDLLPDYAEGEPPC
ncbi:MAG: hypothetical protein A2Y86_06340 [Candidatus Aminicenantes bacterium RBG_13_62_12]|nr:MAG: hypothetical protein A2Y86_06340 [Candidatus Aminicenantes bacterium RBG_13_62_12]